MSTKLSLLLMEALADDAEPLDVLVAAARQTLGSDLKSASRAALSELQTMEAEGLVAATWYEDWDRPRQPTAAEYEASIGNLNELGDDAPSRLWYRLTDAGQSRRGRPIVKTHWRAEIRGNRIRVLAKDERVALRALSEWLLSNARVLRDKPSVEHGVEFNVRGASVLGVAVSCETLPRNGSAS